MPEFDATVTYRPTPRLPQEWYCVGSDGSLWTRKKPGRGAGLVGPWKRLAGEVKGKGYWGYRLGLADGVVDMYGHHAVLEAFIGPCPEGMQCRHLNGDRTDNSVGNLCWGTPIENAEDKQRLGTQPKGSQIVWSKLTEQDIPVIRRRLADGETFYQVAKDYKVSDATIRDIWIGKTWRHVPEAN